MTARRRRDTRTSHAPPARLHRHAALAAAAIALAGLSTPAHAQSSRFSGDLALSSPLVDQGLAITGATPVLQGAVSWASPGGWSAGLATGVEIRSPGTPVMALARVSRAWVPSGDWLVQASLLYYDYRGERGDVIPDRAHANVYFTWRDTLTFGVSAIRVDRGHAQRMLGAADAELVWPLGERLSLSAGAGVAQALVVTRYTYGHWDYVYERGKVYGYGNVGLAWRQGPWTLQLDRTRTSLGSDGAYAGTRQPADWVATVAWSF